MYSLWRCAAVAMAILVVGSFAEQSSIAEEALPQETIVINVPYKGAPYFVPVEVQISSKKLASVKADTKDKQIAYVTRILYQNIDRFPIITEGFQHYEDVRAYIDVPYDPGPGAHIHHLHTRLELKRQCGRMCCENKDKKQCCMCLICSD